tara:strand:- start:135 stop:287 length:153 start_codon:yes stop_codon:yes gene_type:complete
MKEDTNNQGVKKNGIPMGKIIIGCNVGAYGSHQGKKYNKEYGRPQLYLGA